MTPQSGIFIIAKAFFLRNIFIYFANQLGYSILADEKNL